jgi:glucosamine--fructose-6-phosphate aminotransferase (isomerizing)
MALEAADAPSICAAQVATNADLVRSAGQRLRALDAPFAATLARGSSDQAAAFAKVLLETRVAMPTLSHAPSIGALYKTTSPRFAGAVLIAVSQSGQSPDLLAAAAAARQKGALVVAIVNDPLSPLAEQAEIVIPVHAGPERSVAATKTFIGTLVALTHLVAEWAQDQRLLSALDQVGEVLSAAAGAGWSNFAPLLREAQSMLVLGRGLTLPIAGEAALKLKETSGLHAEAFSTAEVAHGPMTLVGPGDPVLVLGPIDEARAGLAERIQDFSSRGATVLAAGRAADVEAATHRLPTSTTGDPVIGAIGYIQSFYDLANALALARGRDPDRPPHLAKVTQTL